MNLISDLFPKNTKLIESSGYNIGDRNETGHWGGLLGYIQRGEAESCFHPIPLDLKAVPGSFSKTLYDSGFGTTAFIRYPLRKETDLASSVFSFKADLVVYFMVTFLIVSLMMSKLFEKRLKVNDAFLVVYRIMFKGMEPQ